MKFTIVHKILTCYLASFLIASPVFADERVTTISEGEVAPFDGTLFNTEAAARILAELEGSGEQCQIRVDRELGLQSAQMQLEIDTLSASLTACNSRYESIVQIKDGHIAFLDDQLQKTTRPRDGLWFAAGVVAGVLITGVAGWSLGQISTSAAE